MGESQDAEVFLIEQVRAGSESAWEEIIVRFQGRLVAFARRRLSDPSECEDIVQETFIGLLRSLANYDKRRSLETYLFAILRNKLSDHFRKRDRGRRQGLDSLELDEAPAAWLDRDSPSVRLAAAEQVDAQRHALVETLRRWVEHCRTQGRFQDLIVVEMLVVMGLRNKEVAEDLGLTETAVAGIKFRVVEQWRKSTLADSHAPEWTEADLARDSTAGTIWQEEGISCLKRSTLGKYLLGVLEEEMGAYVDFHAEQAGCERCAANLTDLQQEDERDLVWSDEFRQRCFTSSVGFLSRRPEG